MWAFDEVVTDAVLLDGLAAAARLLSTLPPCSGIADFSLVSSFEVSNDAIKKLARTPSIFPVQSARVIVAPATYVYGISRMFSILSEDLRPNLHVVHTRDEAYALLGLQSPQFRPLAHNNATAR